MSKSQTSPKRKYDTNTIITFFVMLVAIIAAIISWIGVIQTKKQFKINIDPQLKINGTDIYIHHDRVEYGNNFGKLFIYTHNGEVDTSMFMQDKYGRTRLYYTKRLNNFRLELVNIGFGPAKDLELSWSIDTLLWNNIFSYYRGIAGYNSLGFESERVDTTTLSINQSEDTVKYHDIYYSDRINFVLPQSGKPAPVYIYIPQNYIVLLCLDQIYRMEHLFMKDIHETEYHFNKPPLILDIIYEDVANNKHHDQFRIFPNVPKQLTIFGGDARSAYIQRLNIYDSSEK